MNKESRDKLLKGLATDRNIGMAIRDFLEEKIREFNNIDDVQSWEELLGKQEATKKLKEILRKFTPKQEPEVQKTNYD